MLLPEQVLVWLTGKKDGAARLSTHMVVVDSGASPGDSTHSPITHHCCQGQAKESEVVIFSSGLSANTSQIILILIFSPKTTVACWCNSHTPAPPRLSQPAGESVAAASLPAAQTLHDVNNFMSQHLFFADSVNVQCPCVLPVMCDVTHSAAIERSWFNKAC